MFPCNFHTVPTLSLVIDIPIGKLLHHQGLLNYSANMPPLQHSRQVHYPRYSCMLIADSLKQFIFPNSLDQLNRKILNKNNCTKNNYAS